VSLLWPKFSPPRHNVYYDEVNKKAYWGRRLQVATGNHNTCNEKKLRCAMPVLGSAPLEVEAENTRGWRRVSRRRNSAKVHLNVMLSLRLTANMKAWVYSSTPSILQTVDSRSIPVCGTDTELRQALTSVPVAHRNMSLQRRWMCPAHTMKAYKEIKT
jgi:hypothetical protein